MTEPETAEFGSYNGRNPPMIPFFNPRNVPFSSPPRFRGAGAVRAIGEAGAGCAALLLLARLLEATGEIGRTLANVPDLLSVCWLWTWPAWSLERVTGPLRVRLPLAAIRAIVVGLVLTGIGALLITVLNPGVLRLTQMPEILLWFMVLRVLFALSALVIGWMRRRLRWQLLVSHAAVAVLMLAMLTAVGSVIGLGVGTYGVTPHPAATAAAVADDLSLADAVSVRGRTRIDRILRMIYARRLPLRGEPPLAGFAPTAFLPGSILVTDLRAHILAGRTDLGNDGKRTRPARWSDLRHLGVPWSRVLSLASTGRAVRLGQSGTQVFAEAPVRDGSGALVAVVLLRTTDYRPASAGEIARIIVTAFGVTTVLLIVVAALPLLAVSFLVSYLVARGLTRRLESLSTVATAIAAGDLRKRAPATAGNEIGRLARDVNHMADNLEMTMGQLEGARTQAEEELRLRRRLIADISHELRTPLATIRAYLETVGSHRSVAAGAHRSDANEVVLPAATADALWEETARLESMVEDLFSLSRAEAGALEVRSEPVDIAALTREITERMRPLAQREGGIVLSAEVTADTIMALADPERLHQIVANLVRNAVRHTPEGGIIVLSATRDAEWASICVADTGEGIPEEDLPYIFERFYRADPARSRATGGAGLGLAIVREFVQLMGGRVEVESTVREGTRFRVWLRAA